MNVADPLSPHSVEDYDDMTPLNFTIRAPSPPPVAPQITNQEEIVQDDEPINFIHALLKKSYRGLMVLASYQQDQNFDIQIEQGAEFEEGSDSELVGLEDTEVFRRRDLANIILENEFFHKRYE